MEIKKETGRQETKNKRKYKKGNGRGTEEEHEQGTEIEKKE